MRAIVVGFCLVGLAIPVSAADDPRAQPGLTWIELWPDGAPGAKGTDQEDRPDYAVLRPKEENANGTGVIIFPGGGYNVLAIDHEGLQVANWLNSFGVTAFLVRYRLKPAGYQVSDALADGKRAVRMIRSRAEEYGIDPTRLGVLGFSAGGHLSASIGIDFDKGDPDASDPVEKVSCRPDFMILAYGAASRLGGNDIKNPPADGKTFGPDTPPAFMFTTAQDRLLEWQLAGYRALLDAKVDTELHVFGGYGPHGTGLAPGDPTISQWPGLARRWMRKQGLLTGEARYTVAGTITINGQPLHRGWVTFVPENSNFPIVSRYIPHQKKGRYEIAAEEGLCAGVHRVVVYEVAKEFLTVPSMSDAVMYGKGIVVDVSPGENIFDFGFQR